MKDFLIRSLSYWGILVSEATANKKYQEDYLQDGVHLQRLAWDATVRLAQISYFSTHFNRGNPLFLNIKHGGHASRGGRSPINESSDESQAWLNLNAWLPCVMDNYIKRGWNKLLARKVAPVKEPLCKIQPDFRDKWTPNYDSCDYRWWRTRMSCEGRCSQEILILKI